MAKKIASTALTTVAQLSVIQAYVPTAEEVALGEQMAASVEYQIYLDSLHAAEITLPPSTKVTNENYIVPAGEMGKERWFIKKNLISHTVNADKTVTIVATKRQLKDRGLTL